MLKTLKYILRPLNMHPDDNSSPALSKRFRLAKQAPGQELLLYLSPDARRHPVSKTFPRAVSPSGKAPTPARQSRHRTWAPAQNRAEQSRAERSRAKQSRAEHVTAQRSARGTNKGGGRQNVNKCLGLVSGRSRCLFPQPRNRVIPPELATFCCQ